MLAFSAVSILFLYAFLRLQDHAAGCRLGLRPACTDHGAWNTAVSFVTNTNWQSYSGESTMGHLVQMAGLAVQNFVSAAVGIAVAVALVRGFARSRTEQLGNFWVDLTRITLRILLPIARGRRDRADRRRRGAELLRRHRRDRPLDRRHASTSPAARSPRQEAIKELGTNGGGFYNANSRPPVREPDHAGRTGFEIFLMLVIPFSLPRAFGRMVGDNRQGYAILAVMAHPRASAASP